MSVELQRPYFSAMPSLSISMSTTGCGKKSNPLRFFAVFSAIDWNLKAKLYGHM